MIAISDCTLRDARHAPGMTFTTEEALRVASLLDALGIEEIECGMLSGAADERELIRAVAGGRFQAVISALCLCYSTRVIESSLAFAADCGLRAVCLSIPSSKEFIEVKLKRSYRAVCALLQKAVREAVDRGIAVAFSGEDAARGELPHLIDYIKAGADAGAARFRFAESVSCLTPTGMAETIATLSAETGFPIEVHCHSAYGLGVANSVAAIEAGARGVSVTVDGIGERGGNTALGPILLYLHRFKGQTHYRPGALKELSDYVALVTDGGAHRFAPIVGDSAFHYEFLHQYQMPDLYEAYPPELVGNRKELVYGLKFDPPAYSEMLRVSSIPDDVKEQVRSAIVARRRGLTVAEMETLLRKRSTAETGE